MPSERYIRNMRALSEEESASLRAKRVAVIGCGGLGGYCIESLARVGVGELLLVDGDTFAESNLNRQLNATMASLGQLKARVAAQRVAAVNPDVACDVRCEFLGERNARGIVRGWDCVIDCLDNFESRFWLAHACQEEGIPLVYGSIAGWYGQVCTVFPGDVSFVTVYGAIEGTPDEPLKSSGIEKTEGVLPFTASCTAAFQSAEAVKVLLGRSDVLRNRLLMIDLLFGSCEEMVLA